MGSGHSFSIGLQVAGSSRLLSTTSSGAYSPSRGLGKKRREETSLLLGPSLAGQGVARAGALFLTQRGSRSWD